MKPFNSTASSSPKSRGKSKFRKVNDFLHLWLGLISGIIVFIVCITGCIWVFNQEILYMLHPETRVEWQNKPILSPSTLRKIGEQAVPGEKIDYAFFQQGQAAIVQLGDHEKTHYEVKLDPYSGKVLKIETHQKGSTDFFSWILNGHRFLWMPYEIGRPIVNYGTMIFVVLLITGLIWWYPKKWTQSTVDKSFKIKWNGTFKRVNLDLHNVLGFYSLLFLLAIALTGMVYGIEWYSKGLYWITTGEQLGEYKEPTSDSTLAGKGLPVNQALDKAWAKVIASHPKANGFFYSYPDPKDAKAAIEIYIYPSAGHFYDNRTYIFDQHTLKEIKADDVYGAEFATASFGTKLRKMNYDIHVGSILGLPGKVLAFLASLIGASLPITGFIIWWNRKGFGKSKKGGKKAGKSTAVVPIPSGQPKPASKPKPYKKETVDLIAVKQNPGAE